MISAYLYCMHVPLLGVPATLGTYLTYPDNRDNDDDVEVDKRPACSPRSEGKGRDA